MSEVEPDRSTNRGEQSQGEGLDPAAREVVRASLGLADVATSLLLSLFPQARVVRVEGDPARLLLSPVPSRQSLDRLRAMAFDLVDRPEWRAKHAVAREVSDGDGTRLELLTPIPAREYAGGVALVGPFADQRSAEEWGEDHARSDVSFDTFDTGSAWLCDLFELPGSA